MVCGLSSTVGVNGAPHWDSAKADTTKCLSYSWTFGTGGTARANRCYYCTDKDATDAGKLNLPAFKSPVTDDKTVTGWMMLHGSNLKKYVLLMDSIKTTTK